MYNVDVVTALAMQVEALSKKIDGLLVAQQPTQVGSGEMTEGQGTQNFVEQVNYMGHGNNHQNNPYSNTYNPGWRNHPNFSWGGQNQQRQNQPPGFQQPQQPVKPNLEELMTKYVEASEKRFTQIESTLSTQGMLIQNQEASLHNMENQIGQIAQLLSKRKPGSLPSNTETNPKERVHAIFVCNEDYCEMEEHKVEPKVVLREYKPQIPYPAALFRRENVKAVSSDMEKPPAKPKQEEPLVEAEKKEEKVEHIRTSPELPSKLKDPGSFFIPLTIGSLNIDDALADLGASVNVMSFDLYKKLDLGEPTPTRVPVQLADKSVVHPRGIIENVLVRVGDLTFPVDFMILDMMCNLETPLILGRPFLATSRSIVDVHDRLLTLRVRSDCVEIKDSKVKHHSNLHSTMEKVALSDMVQVPIEEESIDAPKVQKMAPRVKKKRRKTRGRKAKKYMLETSQSKADSKAMCHFIWRVKKKYEDQCNVLKSGVGANASHNAAYKPP